jgi:hypothetical protein
LSGVIFVGIVPAAIAYVKNKDRVSIEIGNVLEEVGYEQAAY